MTWFNSLIKDQCKISIDDFMRHALYNPKHGFYMNHNLADHFITAPEISNLFGQLIALYIINKSREEKINIVELGPGSGILAYDILTTIKNLGLESKFTYQVLEISPHLQQQQKNKLAGFNCVSWLNNLTDLKSENKYFILANEFFDALPVKQYQRQKGNYYERLIEYKNGNYNFVLAEHPTKLNYAEERVELYPDLAKYLTPLKALNADMLFIDYGDLGTGFTLQAMQKHKPVDVFYDIGNCDLTTQVDFRQIVQGLGSGFSYNISTMGDFLAVNGILQLTQKALAKNPKPKNINYILQKYLDSSHMAKNFKVLEISND